MGLAGCRSVGEMEGGIFRDTGGGWEVVKIMKEGAFGGIIGFRWNLW